MIYIQSEEKQEYSKEPVSTLKFSFILEKFRRCYDFRWGKLSTFSVLIKIKGNSINE